MTPRLVIIESPYAGDIKRNTAYARRALLDSLRRGEYPIASHLLYPQVLDEAKAHERQMGIDAGLAWREVADAAVFYVDLGMSPGMLAALAQYEADNVQTIFRVMQSP